MTIKALFQLLAEIPGTRDVMVQHTQSQFNQKRKQEGESKKMEDVREEQFRVYIRTDKTAFEAVSSDPIRAARVALSECKLPIPKELKPKKEEAK